MNWKTYPMGAAAAERMNLRGLTAFQDHAVNLATMQTLCGVKTSSLCMDDSLATTSLPDCPKCQRKIASSILGAVGGATKGASKARTKEQASKAGNTPCAKGKSRGRPVVKYRYLKAGEVVKAGDQWKQISPESWKNAASSLGQPLAAMFVGMCHRPITKTTKGI